MERLADFGGGQEIYRFNGSDEYLLEKMAEAYHEVCNLEAEASLRELISVQIKHAIAEEEKSHAQFTQDQSTHTSVSDRKWEPFTQAGGALVRPDFGPEGVNVTFDNTTDTPFEEDESVRFGADNRGENRNWMSLGMNVVSRDFEDTMMSARFGPRMLSAGPGDDSWGDQTR